MDRNTFTGLFLIMIILAGSFYFLKPNEAEVKREQVRIDSTKRADSLKKIGVSPNQKDTTKTAAVANPAVDSLALKGPFGTAITGTEANTVLENEKLLITLSNKGGKITSVEVKGQKTFTGKPLILFDGNENKFGLNLNAAGKVINTNDLYFTPTKTGNTVTMRANYGANAYVEYVYDLKALSNKVAFNINLVGLQQVIAGNTIGLNWQTTLLQQEKSIESEHRYSAPYYKYLDGDVNHLSVSKDEKEDLSKGKIQWFSFKQHFFSASLISKQAFEKGSLEVKIPTAPGQVKFYDANMQLPYAHTANQVYEMEFYFGTNKFSTLKAQGYDLEQQIDMGYWPLKYINRFIVLPVFNFLNSFGWNYGLIILVLTILLKVALSPLTYKSYLSMAKMRVLKPEMDEIKAKVGEDNPTLVQQEYLKLYKKAGVNPLGGCLPMVLQLPLVMAFFFFFPNLFELRGHSFLWMKDLSTYDEFIKFGVKIPFIGDHLSLMCVLMTISTLIMTYFNNQVSGATGQMKYIGYIMPIIFLGVLNSYPAGLNYYYFLANLMTFGQQFLIRKMVDDEKIHALIQQNKARPADEKKKKSKFQQRLDDYMRQQQQAKK
ncbi:MULTISPECIES: membrane protein insertase YidC [unclassified Pedobacter]|uniref:membrane protein insertase YidC n=1 Tax=unclassified Pedobacter TaxID=2628915 RepID=UPI001421F38A|nr:MULTISPECIES: membrane protein insertase YidC [unclassified Pedobacter]NII82443.1 YidC/Oxa1 family membrane protein insertase [Pedobacter sp. SG908]NMN36468.1 YidC/Oxa1 family membrane protein insertase [Pedobacter sp. SG918]